MLINNIDITTYNARLLNRQIATAPVKSNTDWLDALNSGILLSQKHDYRVMRLTFLVTAESEDEAYKLISKLTDNITKCDIKFDDISYVFPCLLDGTEFPERLQNGVFKVIFNLKNDWALGDDVTEEFDLTPVDAKPYKVKYYRYWNTVGKYIESFTNVQELIAEDTLWVPNAELPSEPADWVPLFLALGLDINKYKRVNEENGFVNVGSIEYTTEAAQNFLNTHDTLEVYYNRFTKDGYADFPIEKYPTKVWMTTSNSNYVQLPWGSGWQPKDTDFYVYGRYYDFVLDGNGSLMGTNTESDRGGYSFELKENDAQIIFTDGQVSPLSWEVFKTDAKTGGNIIIETLEPITATPLRKYGFEGSVNEGTQTGSLAFVFNGVTLDRVQTDSTDTFASNFQVMSGAFGPASYAEVSRAIITHNGNRVADLIPIDCSVGNGFVNKDNAGLYDMINMKFYPYNEGAEVPDLLPIPSGTPGPTPPPAPHKYHVKLNGAHFKGGSSSDTERDFNYGELVEVVLSSNSDIEVEFSQWKVDKGTIPALPANKEVSFNMPREDVEITAEYTEVPWQVRVYPNCASGGEIVQADANAGGMNLGGYGPGEVYRGSSGYKYKIQPGEQHVAFVCTHPLPRNKYQASFSTTNWYFTKETTGYTSDRRIFYIGTCYAAANQRNMYITFKVDDVEKCYIEVAT